MRFACERPDSSVEADEACGLASAAQRPQAPPGATCRPAGDLRRVLAVHCEMADRMTGSVGRITWLVRSRLDSEKCAIYNIYRLSEMNAMR